MNDRRVSIVCLTVDTTPRLYMRERLTLIALLIYFIAFAAVILMAPQAHADHGGPTYEHECPLPNGDPRGWPCTHTESNGLRYIDWSYAYIDDCPAIKPWCA